MCKGLAALPATCLKRYRLFLGLCCGLICLAIQGFMHVVSEKEVADLALNLLQD